MEAKISAKQNAVVTFYVAVCLAALAIAHMLLSKVTTSNLEWFVTILVILLVFSLVFSIRFPGFRLRIFNNNEDVTNDTKSRLTVLWGIIWRLTVCFIPLSILFGLSGASIVVLISQFPIITHMPWLIFPVSFFCFFIFNFVSLYPIMLWWLRLLGRKVRICAVSTQTTPESPPRTTL